MCQIARFAAQTANATWGRNRTPSAVRSGLRASGPRIGAGRRKTLSGPRVASTSKAGARSPISTCWSMWKVRLSSALASRPSNAQSVTAMPSANSAIRPFPARSCRPRRRSRMTACAKRSVPRTQRKTTITAGLCRRRRAARPSEAEQLGDDHALTLVRALADLEDLLVAEQAGDRELFHEAVAAVDLQRGVHDAIRQQSGVQLRLRGGEPGRLPVVFQPGGAVDELASRLDLGRHVGELELHGLELRDGLPELLPLLRVRKGEVVCALSEPDAHGGDRDAAA